MKLRDKPKKQVRDESTLAERLNWCAAMLSVNGLLTDAERSKVHARLVKKVRQEKQDAE